MNRLLLTTIFVVALIESALAAAVYCEHPDDCPPAINQLHYKNKRCTAFLVARDLIATNLHCLPEHMNREKQKCEGMSFEFPKSKNHEPETLNCKTIEFLSEPLEVNSTNVDLAILRTESPTNREPLNFSQEGFENDKEYTIYKIDPSENTGGGVVIKLNCPAIQNSIVNPYFTSDKSPIVNFIPCHVIPGNSGSPILSSSNEVRGIIHSSSDGKIFQMFEDQQRKMDTKIYTAFGTSFSCVHLDLFSYPRYNHSACNVKISSQNSRELEKIKNDELAEKISTAVKIEFNKFNEKINALKNEKMYVLQWKFGPQDSKLDSKNIFNYAPLCFNSQAFKDAHVDTLNLDLLEIELNNTIDNHLRYKFNIKSKIHRNKVFMEIKPSEKMRVDMNYSSGLKTFTIEACKKQP